MFAAEDTIHLDIGDLSLHFAEVRTDAEYEEERDNEREITLYEMKEALESGMYSKAFESARQLKNIGFSKNRDEILSCYKECAEHDVVEALQEMVSLSVDRRKTIAKPEAFPYLYRLSELGYVESLRWLADCYYYGIGCEADKSKANRCYFEDFLFNDSEYSKSRLQLINPALEEYSGDDIIKKVMRQLVFGHNKYYYSSKAVARVKTAEMILDGQIKEYSAETGYYILRNLGKDITEDGVAKLRLGECVLNGIGTKPNAFAALEVLEEAQFEIQWTLDHMEEEETRRELIYDFHDGYDYGLMLDRVNALISEANEKISRVRATDSYWSYIEGCMSEDEVLNEWYDEKLTRIIRKDKSV